MRDSSDRSSSAPSRPDAVEGDFIGIDAGASLVKLAHGGETGPVEFRTWPAGELDSVMAHLEAANPKRVGATGCRAGRLLADSGLPGVRVDEFAAWGAGCARMLGSSRPERHLIVSIGTGTSVLFAEGDAVQRVGGTALGGGTILGLGHGLIGTRNFEKLCRLASAGNKTRVDLSVGDIYRDGEIPLAPETTASALAKLGLHEMSDPDLAAGIMNLVGENIGLICGGLAALTQSSEIVYGGGTLAENPAFVDHLTRLASAYGVKARILPEGRYTGAVGALVHALSEDP